MLAGALIAAAGLVCVSPVVGEEASSSTPAFAFRGLVSGWVAGRFAGPVQPLSGIRFIPEAGFSLSAGRGLTLDVEAAANAVGTVQFLPGETLSDARAELYRGWVRLSSSRFEARLGLQKLSFGSASLLRPLMWFDTLDPRDPLQITGGVYALLFRYYIPGNATFWIWGMAGNDRLRGWDTAPTDKKKPEFGGRFQVPLGSGELALTYHRRRADVRSLMPSPLPAATAVPEDRVGLDGKWDVGVGLWFEAALIRQNTALLARPWRRVFDLGLDYTFGLGRGLYALAEHFVLREAPTSWGNGPGLSLTAFLLRYPLGLLDELSAIVYSEWDRGDLYRFVQWRRAYDRWSLHAILFWNPKSASLYRAGSGGSLFSGRGFQILAAYNF